MSTDYTMLEKEDLLISLYESSSKFSLSFTTSDPKGLREYRDSLWVGAATPLNLTVEDLLKVALDLIVVASYFKFDALGESVAELIKAKSDKEYYVECLDKIYSEIKGQVR